MKFYVKATFPITAVNRQQAKQIIEDRLKDIPEKKIQVKGGCYDTQTANR